MAYYRRGDYDDDDRPGSNPVEVVPDLVKTFVAYMYRHIREQNVYEIHQMYTDRFNAISDRMYNQTAWPSAESISQYVDDDHIFCLLYREMTFRHLYAKLTPTLEQRIESWENYCQLFRVILQENVNMQLPNNWLWDMVDEFIYQFQSFCQFRAKMKARTDAELSMLRANEQTWNVYGVLNYLQALIEKSDIIQILDDDAEGRSNFTETEGYDHQGGSSNVLKVLGYFSIVGLMRVHCLLGDYQTALVRLSPIDITRHGLYRNIIGCYIAIAYHCSFASIMQRKYTDAIKVLNVILDKILKHKPYLEGLTEYEQVLKKYEQMAALLAMTLSLSPHSRLVLDDVNAQLSEKYGDKMGRMQRGEETVFDELFSFACPKFITPSLPDYDQPPVNYSQDAYAAQLRLFLGEVREQSQLLALRSHLTLHSTVTIAKLAQYINATEATVRSILLTYKHKTTVVEADGSTTSTADLNFFIDDDIVHVAEAKVNPRFGDYMIKHIFKFEEVIHDLKQVGAYS